MSTPVATQDRVTSLRETAANITSGLCEAHSVMDSLTGILPAVSEKISESDSIIGQLEITMQMNLALTVNLIRRLGELKTKL
jgi:hypothetical protein